MKSGNYFKGVRKQGKVVYIIDYRAWMKQIVIWMLLVAFAKMFVVAVQYALREIIGTIGDKVMEM